MSKNKKNNKKKIFPRIVIFLLISLCLLIPIFYFNSLKQSRVQSIHGPHNIEPMANAAIDQQALALKSSTVASISLEDSFNQFGIAAGGGLIFLDQNELNAY